MALNLKDAKKISGDNISSTFAVKGGHQIKIAHAPLSTIHRKQIESMPVQKFETGGDVGPDLNLSNGVQQPNNHDQPSLSQEIADNIPSALVPGNALPEKYGPPDSDATQGPAPASADSTSGQTPHDQIPPAPPTGMDAATPPVYPSSSGVDLGASYRQGQQGITEQQGVNSQLSQANSEILKDDVQRRQDLAEDAKDNLGSFIDHQQSFINDYMNGHIDPKHYQENMGAGQKIGTAIGLLLGGAGAHSYNGVNPAEQFLNKQIDRDIKGQEMRQDQQKTLLGANQSLFQDKQTALNQTRLNMNDIYDHKIQQAAQQLGTPQAKAIADQAHAKFAMENAALLQQNAIRTALMKNLQNGGGGVDALDLAHAGITTPEQATKEQASINSQKQAIANVNNLYTQANKEQTTGNIINPESARRVGAINAGLTNANMEADASKRLTPESAQLEVKPFWVNTTDDAATRAFKNQGMLNLIKTKHAGETPTMEKYAPGSIPKYQSALGQPAQIQTRGGVQYQKVPGGWAPVK